MIDRPKIQIDLPPKPDAIKSGGAWPLTVDHVENWAWIENIFSDQEIKTIIRIGTNAELSKASTYGSVQSDEIRNSSVQFLFPNEYTSWIFAKLAPAITQINSKYFQFDLSGMEQGLQFTRYEAPGQHYDWHVDRGFMTPTRKLSVSVQLSKPEEYEGGELELRFGQEPDVMNRAFGLATFFPSYTLHRVKPVTKGVRYSLVAWVSGPPFK